MSRRNDFRREVADVRKSPLRREQLMSAFHALTEIERRGQLTREMHGQFEHVRKIIDALKAKR